MRLPGQTHKLSQMSKKLTIFKPFFFFIKKYVFLLFFSPNFYSSTKTPPLLSV